MPKDKKKSRKKTVDEMPAVVEPRRTTSSPVYPAVSESQKALEPIRDDPPPSTPPQPSKSHRKGREAASWALKVALVAVPAFLSGFFSYLSSKSDSEAGYKATVTAVEELQEATKELVKQQAYMQGQIDTMRRTSKVTSRPPPPPELKTKVMLSDLPTDLGSAVKSKGRPMEQKTLNFYAPDAPFSPEEKAVLDDAEKKRALAVEELQKRRDAKRAAEDKTPAPAAPP